MSPTDPFANARRESGILDGDFLDEPIPMILRYRDVRRAAQDWGVFSSDAPCRVPIPSEERVRTVRQLPIETDPPMHAAYRAIVAPFFRRPADPAYQAQIHALVAHAVDEALARDTIEAVSEFALPLQSRALALMLGAPMDDAAEWIGWGRHALYGEGAEGGSRLDAYIDAALRRARAQPGDDLFSTLMTATIDTRPLTREEIFGFANLVFAGGRDTVIAMITATLAHLAETPHDFARLRADARLHVTACEEILRFVSPLTHIGRVCPRGGVVAERTIAPGARASLCWASANRDESVFENADVLDIARNPNPHVAFGSGVHACLGAQQARLLLRGLIAVLCRRVAFLEVLDVRAAEERWPHYTRMVGHHWLTLRMHAL